MKVSTKELFLVFALLCVFTLRASDFLPHSFVYLLQADQISENRAEVVKLLSNCDADLIIIDAFYQSWEFEGGRWTKDEIREIRNGKRNRKILAYLSIGEAENYRAYWQKKWDKNDDGIPDEEMASPFLMNENPNWEGNYKVKYWHRDWQKIILDELAKIIEQDFDGVYLDIVDAFSFFEYDKKNNKWISNRKNPETKNTYREDMINFVEAIAKFARERKKDFLIVPQNAEELLEEKKYVKIIDGIGIEDLFTDNNRPKSDDDVQWRMNFLEKIKKAKKPVLLIEYCRDERLIDKVEREARKNGFVLLIADR